MKLIEFLIWDEGDEGEEEEKQEEERYRYGRADGAGF